MELGNLSGQGECELEGYILLIRAGNELPVVARLRSTAYHVKDGQRGSERREEGVGGVGGEGQTKSEVEWNA